MASISTAKNGTRRLLVVLPDGSRKAIRLGRMPLREVTKIKVKVEDLVYAKTSGHAPANETALWLTDLDAALYNKLAGLGLVRPRESVTLGAFIDTYIASRADVKPGTRTNYGQVRRYLLGCFDPNRPLRDFTPGDAEDFRAYMVKRNKAENTTRRAIGRARQFFRAAMRRGLVQANPFEGLAAAVKGNPEKFYYISREDAMKVMDACPDAEWRLIFALARWGGLRCPSEILALRLEDVDWAEGRIRVTCVKTAGYAGKETRTIPLFPELRAPLLECHTQAPDGQVYFITRYRSGSQNLRTQLDRIIRQAKLEPWPKPFQNLRSTRATELSEGFPAHVVAAWLGHSQAVAAKHYLQVTDEHYERASSREASLQARPRAHAREAAQKAAREAAQKAPAADCAELQTFPEKPSQAEEAAGLSDDLHVPAIECRKELLTPTGFEPVLPA